MREIRKSGSEGGAGQNNVPFLPLSLFRCKVQFQRDNGISDTLSAKKQHIAALKDLNRRTQRSDLLVTGK